MTKKSVDEFKRGFKIYTSWVNKLGTLIIGNPTGLVIRLIQYGLIFLSIILIIELFNYDDLNYQRIYLLMMFTISLKLSYLIQLLK